MLLDIDLCPDEAEAGNKEGGTYVFSVQFSADHTVIRILYSKYVWGSIYAAGAQPFGNRRMEPDPADSLRSVMGKFSRYRFNDSVPVWHNR